MLTEFSIGNYQAFSAPQRVPLKPITLIFGPNSAGKSALLRSLLLVRQAILDETLAKNTNSHELHPGKPGGFLREKHQPLLISFTTHHGGGDGELGSESHQVDLLWNANEDANVETHLMNVSLNEEEVFRLRRNSEITELTAEFIHARLISKAQGAETKTERQKPHEWFQDRITVTSTAALPGSRQADFVESWINERHDAPFFNQRNCLWRKIQSIVASVRKSLETDLEKMTYYGPIRPIPMRVEMSDVDKPMLSEWWKLAYDPDALMHVNRWFASNPHTKRHWIHFDFVLPCSRLNLSNLVEEIGREVTPDQAIKAAFKTKLRTDPDFAKKLVEDHMYVYWDDNNPNKCACDSKEEAMELSYWDIDSSSLESCWAHFDELYSSRGRNSALEFLLAGVSALKKDGARKHTFEGAEQADIYFVNLATNAKIPPSNLGVGFSQMLPLIVSAFTCKKQLIAIEQPELHVHPAMQTELADLFIESAKERGNRFLIETHSEHLILRIMRRIRETTRNSLPEGKQPIKAQDVAILYVQPGENGSTVQELRIDEHGRFVDNWPQGFFEERLDEMF